MAHTKSEKIFVVKIFLVPCERADPAGGSSGDRGSPVDSILNSREFLIKPLEMNKRMR